MKPRFYAVVLAKGAAAVPLKLWFGPPVDPDTGEELDRAPRWNCIRNGESVGIEEAAFLVDNQDPIIKGIEIDEDEYEFLTVRNSHDREHDPESPFANPRQRIDLTKIPPIKWNP